MGDTAAGGGLFPANTGLSPPLQRLMQGAGAALRLGLLNATPSEALCSGAP